MDIPWQHEASMTRSTPAGEELVGRGILRQLVGAFLELPAERRRGVAIRVPGPSWTCEYGDEEIRELASRPEYAGASGSGTEPHATRESRPADC